MNSCFRLVIIFSSAFVFLTHSAHRSCHATSPYVVTQLTLPPSESTGFAAFEFRSGQDSLYFAGETQTGLKIYRTDGTSVEPLINNPQSVPALYVGYVEVDGSIFYNGVDNPFSDSELWRFDGTSSTLFSDLYPGGYSSPGPFYRANDFVVFSASTSPTDRQLFKIENNVVSHLPGTGPYPHGFVGLGNDVYFFAGAAELYKTDGDSVTPLGSGGPGDSMAITQHNGQVFLAQYLADGAMANSEIWKYDGGSFERLAQLPTECLGCTDGFIEFAGDLYITLSDPFGANLFRVDDHSIVPVTDLAGTLDGQYPSVRNPRVAGNYLYFLLDSPSSKELYRFDGQTSTKMTDVDPIFATVRFDYAGFNGELVFAADGPLGRELYRYDGVSMELLADIVPGAGSSTPRLDQMPLFTTHQGDFYFNAVTPDGYRLFKLSAVPEPASLTLLVFATAFVVRSPRMRHFP